MRMRGTSIPVQFAPLEVNGDRRFRGTSWAARIKSLCPTIASSWLSANGLRCETTLTLKSNAWLRPTGSFYFVTPCRRVMIRIG